MQFKMKNTTTNWICSDRELMLRSKLEAGWSVKSSNFRTTASNCKEETEKSSSINQITDLEQEIIIDVLQRSQRISEMEQKRINKLLEKLKTMKRNAKGESFSFFSNPHKVCNDCRKCICAKCSVTNYSTSKKKIILCRLCDETRQCFIKSGAWWNNSLPNFCYNLSDTLQNKAADSLHRRCSSQTYFDIINSNNKFELCPSKAKSNFLQIPSFSSDNEQTINITNNSKMEDNQISDFKQNIGKNSQNNPTITEIDQTIMFNNQIIQSDEPIDHNLAQSLGQCLGQTFRESLERNLEQSMQHTQQQPDLFKSKEEEKLKELEKDDKTFVVELMTPTNRVRQTKFISNQICEEPTNHLYDFDRILFDKHGQQYSNKKMDNHSNSFETNQVPIRSKQTTSQFRRKKNNDDDLILRSNVANQTEFGCEGLSSNLNSNNSRQVNMMTSKANLIQSSNQTNSIYESEFLPRSRLMAYRTSNKQPGQDRIRSEFILNHDSNYSPNYLKEASCQANNPTTMYRRRSSRNDLANENFESNFTNLSIGPSNPKITESSADQLSNQSVIHTANGLQLSSCNSMRLIDHKLNVPTNSSDCTSINEKVNSNFLFYSQPSTPSASPIQSYNGYSSINLQHAINTQMPNQQISSLYLGLTNNEKSNQQFIRTNYNFLTTCPDHTDIVRSNHKAPVHGSANLKIN